MALDRLSSLEGEETEYNIRQQLITKYKSVTFQCRARPTEFHKIVNNVLQQSTISISLFYVFINNIYYYYFVIIIIRPIYNEWDFS